MHVAVSSIERLLDYVMNTPEDGLSSAASVKTVYTIIENNLQITNAFRDENKSVIAHVRNQ